MGEGRQFDVIFGDLTDIPVHGNDTSTWNFVRTVVRTSLLLLPIGGKYYTHINGINSPSSIALFENMVEGLGVPVEIASTEAHVPSFMEKWVFYQLTRKEGDVKEEGGEEAKVNGVEHAAAEKKEDAKQPEDAAKEAAKSDEKESEKSELAKEDKKEESKASKDDKKKPEKKEEKKDDKKTGSKEALESPKEKGLTKEKSNVDKKGGTKKAK